MVKIPLPPELIAKVNDSAVTEDLELPASEISLVAGYLWAHQNSEAHNHLMREAQKKDGQRRKLDHLLNSARNAERGLHRVMGDPVLSQRLLNAYTGMDAAEVHYFRPAVGGLDLYVGEFDAPENPEQALLGVRVQLSMLIKALESLEPEPSPNAKNKRTQEALAKLVNNLRDVIKPFAGEINNVTIADYVRELLSLIGLEYKVKSIQNLLS